MRVHADEMEWDAFDSAERRVDSHGDAEDGGVCRVDVNHALGDSAGPQITVGVCENVGLVRGKSPGCAMPHGSGQRTETTPVSLRINTRT
jgi:hypothetical protein